MTGIVLNLQRVPNVESSLVALKPKWLPSSTLPEIHGHSLATTTVLLFELQTQHHQATHFYFLFL